MIEWSGVLSNVWGLEYHREWLQIQSRKDAKNKFRIEFLPIDDLSKLVEPIDRKMYIILQDIGRLESYKTWVFEISISEGIECFVF